jgi:hypothetical protein
VVIMIQNPIIPGVNPDRLITFEEVAVQKAKG